MVSISVKVIVPKHKFADKKWVEGVASALKEKTAPKLKALFRKSTFGWSKHPSFRQTLTRRAYSLSMEVYTDDALYGLVNAGSPPHKIPAKKGGFLRFRPGYRAATKPGSLQSGRAYRSGKFVLSRGIIDPQHPGFKARKFDELVAKEYEPQFRDDIQSGIDKAART